MSGLSLGILLKPFSAGLYISVIDASCNSFYTVQLLDVCERYIKGT